MDKDGNPNQEPSGTDFSRGVEENWKDVKPDFTSSVTGKSGSNNKQSTQSKDSNPAGHQDNIVSKHLNDPKIARGASQYNDIVRDLENNPADVNYTGKGKKKSKGKKGKLSASKVSVGVLVFFVILIVGGIVAVGSPLYQIGSIDYNLQESLGFTGTVGILEKQAEHVVKDEMARGEVPDALAGKLASHGLTVGQVTASGDFVRTNVYVADADKLKDLAVLGHFEVQPEDGELAMLYDNRVIKASEFVAAVESNPVMYAEFSGAIEIGALYYYGEDASQAIADAGGNRSMFADWKDLGSEEKNKEQYNNTLSENINDISSVTLAGITGDDEQAVSRTENSDIAQQGNRNTTTKTLPSPDGASVMFAVENSQEVTKEEGTTETLTDTPSDSTDDSSSSSPSTPAEGSFQTEVSNDDTANTISEIAEKTKDKSPEIATKKATQLLNMLVSSVEPYLAVKSFFAIEEPIQRARITGEGPIHETMDMLYETKKLTYYDVIKKETVESEQPIIATGNFVAAVSKGKFSSAEAASFNRDRSLAVMDFTSTTAGGGNNMSSTQQNFDAILTLTGDPSTGENIITDTTVSSDGQKNSDVVLKIGRDEAADGESMKVLNQTIDLALGHSNLDLLPTIVGGQRITEGGRVVNNFVNTHSIAAMASDQDTMNAFHRETKEVIARKAEAERATKSPFDISSPYTFLGSIVHSMSSALIRNNASTGGTVIGTIADLTNSSVKDTMNSVIADGDDDSYDLTYGDNCEVAPSAANIKADIFCTAQTAISTGYMERGKDEWDNAINQEEYEMFVNTAMDRKTTVGVKSVEACERWREKHSIPIISKLSGIFGGYEACSRSGLENLLSQNGITQASDSGSLADLEAVATGAYYTFSNDNANKEKALELAGYALYDQVSSLLENRTSRAAQIRADYYATHPQDNSKVGRLASISGLSKQEVQVALDYADYLAMIARYNPANRFVFGAPVIERPAEPLIDHANQISSELYMLWHGRTEYDDLRNRIRIG